MEKVIALFTGVLASFALGIKQIALLFHVFSDESLQRIIFYLTIAWLVMQISMNARKWHNQMKEFIRKNKRKG